MKKLLFGLSLLFLGIFTACEDDSKDISEVEVTITYPTNLGDKSPVFQSGTLTLTNVNSGYETVLNLTSMAVPALNLEYGLYHIELEGNVSYSTFDAMGVESNQTAQVRALEENYEFGGANQTVNLDLFLVMQSSGFVISEIFFSGSLTPEGKNYSEDAYIEIYNNSSEDLYADGLCIAESGFKTSTFVTGLSPDETSTHAVVGHIYKIPGNGTEHLVKPGETFLLCDLALDHTSENVNSFDLSHADFEWYDGPDYDSDVPTVPNMVKMASTSKSSWTMHNRGFTSYFLFKMDDISPETFVEEYDYSYDYQLIVNDNVYDRSGACWKVPNEYIIDAVECSTPSSFEWKIMNPSLDISWTHCGDGDDARYGKSVKRKVDRVESDGRKVLLDTNDSAFDFIPTAEPSPGTIEDK